MVNIFTARKYENKIKSIITLSEIYSINEISRRTNISEADVIKLIEGMITKGSNLNWDYRAFRNGHINFQTREVVLDESKKTGIPDKIGKLTNSFFDRRIPKEEVAKVEWKCNYCQNINAAEANKCEYCAAKKD